MKKTLLCLLCAVLLCTALSPALALTIDGESAGYNYTVDLDHYPFVAKLTSYNGAARDGFILPHEIDGYPVADMSYNLFYREEGWKTVFVPKDHPSFATIDGVLFQKKSATLVAYPHGRSDSRYEIPAGVRRIGSYAFMDSGLTSVTLPDSVTGIGNNAFYACRSLTSINIPGRVTGIGSSAFYACSGLTALDLPDSVTSIGDSAFCGCTGLTSVAIPDSVTSIGDRAFYGCRGLSTITIPDSVTSIGVSAFFDCGDVIIEIIGNSYAEAYCLANGLKYTASGVEYGDTPADWLQPASAQEAVEEAAEEYPMEEEAAVEEPAVEEPAW